MHIKSNLIDLYHIAEFVSNFINSLFWYFSYIERKNNCNI